MARVYLGLGSNLGDRRQQLRNAVSALEELGVEVTRASSLYESEPMYELDQPSFLNAVLQAETELAPLELLRSLKEIEAQLGRQPRQRNGPREIDIDILAYEDVQMDTPELTIPHPRMRERPFVTVPLRELGAPIGPRPSGGHKREDFKVRQHPPFPGDASLDAQHDTPATAFPAKQREQVRVIEGPGWAVLPGGEDSSLRSLMTPQTKLRLFVAVDVDDRVRSQVARIQNALKPEAHGVKWVAPELCHITLNFLGYVPAEQLESITSACRAAAQTAGGFELEFKGVGAFPSLRRARVLWVGLGSGEAQLAALQRATTGELQRIGFEPEDRPFSPHLTLGRFKAPASRSLEELVKPFANQRFGHVQVSELQLMRSDLRPSGPIYTVMEKFPLG